MFALTLAAALQGIASMQKGDKDVEGACLHSRHATPCVDNDFASNISNKVPPQVLIDSFDSKARLSGFPEHRG